jgi:hypothetical protein
MRYKEMMLRAIAVPTVGGMGKTPNPTLFISSLLSVI